MEYFDSRGVRGTYGVSLEDGVLRIWRDDPTFAQRFSATLGHESFEGQWQLARTPGDWLGRPKGVRPPPPQQAGVPEGVIVRRETD
jgi:hypothetical protein